jgi:Putative phage abortive infection protein
MISQETQININKVWKQIFRRIWRNGWAILGILLLIIVTLNIVELIDLPIHKKNSEFILLISGGCFVLQTIASQRQANRLQQFESRFFQLVELHRQNVSEMKSKGEKGIDVFRMIFEEVDKAYKIVKSFGTKHSLDECEQISMAYLIVFFGVGKHSTQVLRNVLSKNWPSKQGFQNDLIQTLSKIHSAIKISNEYLKTKDRKVGKSILKKYKKRYDLLKNNRTTINYRKEYNQWLLFDGHQTRLSHYHRHLFQTVKYVDKQKFLFDWEKYDYIKTLRAQLSTHEQAIFFFNSLSPLGAPWELNTNAKIKLITKYNFIKNLPMGFTLDVDAKKYFPKIDFEFNE